MDKKTNKAIYMREYRAKNKEAIKKKNDEKYLALGYTKRFHDVLIKYRITKEQYDAMLIAQNDCCYICKRPEKRIDAYSKEIARLCIDHNHDTNKVRALLCNACNSGIGFLRENTMTMHKAVAYLQKHAEAK